jgi:hypothetical protein
VGQRLGKRMTGHREARSGSKFDKEAEEGRVKTEKGEQKGNGQRRLREEYKRQREENVKCFVR